MAKPLPNKLLIVAVIAFFATELGLPGIRFLCIAAKPDLIPLISSGYPPQWWYVIAIIDVCFMVIALFCFAKCLDKKLGQILRVASTIFTLCLIMHQAPGTPAIISTVASSYDLIFRVMMFAVSAPLAFKYISQGWTSIATISFTIQTTMLAFSFYATWSLENYGTSSKFSDWTGTSIVAWCQLLSSVMLFAVMFKLLKRGIELKKLEPQNHP